MSPFEKLIEQLAKSVDGLSENAKVTLFANSASALFPAYLRWCKAAGNAPSLELFQRALASTESAAIYNNRSQQADLLNQIEANIPSQPSDVSGYTAAQDCWICIDTAARAHSQGYVMSDSAWYILEPIFQNTSERLFEYYDVGSEAQQLEEFILKDARFASAVASLEESMSILQATSVTKRMWDEVSRKLEAIAP